MKARFVVLLLVCLLLSGCSGEKQELVELENENERLMKEIDDLRLSNAALTNRVNGLEQMNLALKLQLDEGDKPLLIDKDTNEDQDKHEGLSIKVVSKVNDPKNSQNGSLRDKVKLLIALENSSGKTITAIEGDIVVTDEFAHEILRLQADLLNKRVMSYGVANYKDIVYEVNSMDVNDRKFYQTPFEGLTFTYHIKTVIYE